MDLFLNITYQTKKIAPEIILKRDGEITTLKINMAIKQKTIWMQLLLIGILSSFQSCNKEEVDKLHHEEYYFINKSDYEIVIETISKIDKELYKNTYKMKKDSTFFQETEVMFGSTTSIIAHSDSVVVEFGDIKRMSYIPDTLSQYNTLNPNNYESVKIKNNRYKYTYTFTNNDFENALDMN